MHPSNSSGPHSQGRPVSGGSSAAPDSSRLQTQRATWHDYRQRGVYMLTICTEGRRPLFGRLVPDESGTGTVQLTPLGEELEQVLRGISVEYEEVEFIRWVVMPDHLHVVVQVHHEMSRHLGEVVRRLKYLSTVAYLKELDLAEGGRHRIEGGRLSKREREAMKKAADEGEGRAADKPQPTGPERGDIIFVPRLWQENYHDRVLTEYGQLTKMLNYVADNPRRAWIKRQHPRLFYDKWTLDWPLTAELARSLYHEAQSLGEVKALESCLIVDRSGDEVRTSLRFRAMGNYFLAGEATLLPLRVSRSATPKEIAALSASLDERCFTERAVVITPCVSRGEQRIVDDLLAAGHRVIRVQHEAMSMLYAPSANHFSYVAGGQMLLLAPWPDQPLSNHPSKGRFELMNAICRVLCGLPA